MFKLMGALLVLAATPAAGVTGLPKVGVYGCFGPNLEIAPSFGLIDGGNYVDSQNKRGRYTYVGDLLTMTTGGMAGTKFKRTHDIQFRLLRDTGAMTGIACVLEPKKSLTNPKGW